MNALAEALREKIAKWRGMKKGDLYLAAQICADELERLLAEHDAQPAQAAQPSADAEDAARYRWLRPRLLTADFEYGDDSETVLVFLIPTTMAVSANLDKSIDAARAAEGNGNG